jgi:hypothetical protein
MSSLGYDAAMIRDAYVAPLRSALMIDDRFPTYQDMLERQRQRDAGEAVEATAFDYESATKLVAECREHNLLCDVQNKIDEVATAQLDHLSKSDLVVLDYHLDPTQNTNPEKAIAVLQRLAQSPHANLVIVYTLEGPLDAVRRTVACRFRGATELPTRQTLNEDEELFIQMWEPTFTGADIDAYLRGDNKVLLDSNSHLVKALDGHVPKNEQKAVILEAVELHLRSKFLPGETAPKTVPVGVQMNPKDGQRQWLSFGNVFVVFINKNKDVSIFSELEAALLEWQPLPMKMMIAHIRNQFETGGFRFEAEILSDADKLAGWFFHALTGDDPELRRRLQQLWGRLLDSLRAQLVISVAEFGTRILDPSITALGAKGHDSDAEWFKKCMKLAKELAGTSTKIDDHTVLHALNSFLCSETYSGRHVRTGTVCRVTVPASDGSGKEQWYLCASPACEMVPRPPRGSGAWTHDLDPLMSVTVLRLERQANFRSSLDKAEQGKHIFLLVDGQPVSFEVVNVKTGHPNSEVMFVENRGLTKDDGSLHAYFIRRSPDANSELVEEGQSPAVAPDTAEIDESNTLAPDIPEQVSPERAILQGGEAIISKAPLMITTVKLQAVGQLRASYADRFLHQLGHHSSRIGVDFVNSY